VANPSDSSGSSGYKKPPRLTQFKKGQSGNPRGRPKGSKSLATVAQEELVAKAFYTENGIRKGISKDRAMLRHLVNKAAAGDYKAIPPLLKMLGIDNNRSNAAPPDEVLDTREDQMVMETIIQRILSAHASPAPADADTPHETPPSPSDPSSEEPQS
jgi:hypothetical protein